jgi:hypothetical protein
MPIIIARQVAYVGRSWQSLILVKSMKPYLKNKAKELGAVDQVVEYLVQAQGPKLKLQ